MVVIHELAIVLSVAKTAFKFGMAVGIGTMIRIVAVVAMVATEDRGTQNRGHCHAGDGSAGIVVMSLALAITVLRHCGANHCHCRCGCDRL